MTNHPPFTGRFIFAVDGVQIGAFTEVSGLEVNLQTEEIQEGGQNEFVHRVPGQMQWSNLVLKRGVTTDNNLFEWFQRASGEGFASRHDRLDRTTAALAMLDGRGEVLRTWVFFDAFPVKWTGPQFAAASSDVAVEELEIAHHGFRVDI